ncbi:MAG: DUF1232 domain-containing protein [Spirochaetaceae bacterium]|jgi:uncharacterized membrane protein YkvA (DUF1232 family)|nr:DUF1232 domain-containing protein [Spirochaetaceae bacterium]
MFAKLKEKSKQITRNLSILYIAYKRKDVPMPAKIIGAAAIIYALSPLDLIPDFIPVLGYLDDLIILPLLIYLSIIIIPKNIFEECKEEAEKIIIDRKYKRWYYGIPVIIIWAITGIVILKHILGKIF